MRNSTADICAQFCRPTNTRYIELCLDAVCETLDWDKNTLLDLEETVRPCAITIEHASQRIAIPAFAYNQIPA